MDCAVHRCEWNVCVHFWSVANSSPRPSVFMLSKCFQGCRNAQWVRLTDRKSPSGTSCEISKIVHKVWSASQKYISIEKSKLVTKMTPHLEESYGILATQWDSEFIQLTSYAHFTAGVKHLAASISRNVCKHAGLCWACMLNSSRSMKNNFEISGCKDWFWWRNCGMLPHENSPAGISPVKGPRQSGHGLSLLRSLLKTGHTRIVPAWQECYVQIWLGLEKAYAALLPRTLLAGWRMIQLDLCSIEHHTKIEVGNEIILCTQTCLKLDACLPLLSQSVSELFANRCDMTQKVLPDRLVMAIIAFPHRMNANLCPQLQALRRIYQNFHCLAG